MIVIPARAAFCTISKLTRPETTSTVLARGSRPSSRARPTACRRRCAGRRLRARDRSRPTHPRAPAAWRPPVASNTVCSARSRSGRPSATGSGSVGPAPSGAHATSSWSSVVLPQIPQLALLTRSRRWPARSTGRRVATRHDVVLLLGLRRRGSTAPRRGRPRRSMIPSVRQNPTANSKSWPGVRIITASGRGAAPGASMRISIGSSVTSRSGRSRSASRRTHRRAPASSGGGWRRRARRRGYRGISIPHRRASLGSSTSASATASNPPSRTTRCGGRPPTSAWSERSPAARSSAARTSASGE